MSGRWSNYSEVDDFDLEVEDLDLEAEEWDEQGVPARSRAPRPSRKRTEGEIELEVDRDSKRNKPRREAPPHKRREELG